MMLMAADVPLTSALLETLEAYVILTGPEGKIQAINKSVEQAFGYSEFEVRGQPAWEVFRRPDQQAELRGWFEELRAGMRDPEEFPSGYERAWVTQTGECRWVAWSNTVLTGPAGQVETVLGTGIDVTERRQANQELQAQKAQLEAILSTAADGIITIDERGVIQTFNEAAEQIFGYEAGEVRGEKVNRLMPEPYRTEHDDYMKRYLSTGEAHIIGTSREVTGQRKDGSVFPMRLAVSEVEVPGEDRRLFTGIVHDRSEERALEREVLRAADQERRSIAQELHDGLGSALGGMRYLAETIEKELREDGVPQAEDIAQLAEYLDEADETARQLARGIRPTEFEAGGLPAALDRLARRIEDQYEVEVRLDGAEDPAIEDETRAVHLFRIAQEALRNAARHGEADRVEVHLAEPEGHLRLRIRDDGKGFPEDFDLGDQDGIGIRSMRYRARLCGGELRIRSDGDGTTVTCHIPRQERGSP